MLSERAAKVSKKPERINSRAAAVEIVTNFEFYKLNYVTWNKTNNRQKFPIYRYDSNSNIRGFYDFQVCKHENQRTKNH